MPKVLVADDAKFMIMMIRKTLEVFPTIEVVEAYDGAMAVTVFTAESPDLTFLDITMPNLDGIGALKQIKEINPNAKCCMCSAMGQEGMVVEAIKSGALDFIVKPFKPDRIHAVIKNVLGLAVK